MIGCSLNGLDLRRVIMLLSMCDIEASRLVLKEAQLGMSATNSYQVPEFRILARLLHGGLSSDKQGFLHPPPMRTSSAPHWQG